jgi:uronate dehydrogenase
MNKTARQGRRILLTGAAGRIGQAFWRARPDRSGLRLADLALGGLADAGADAEVMALDIRDAEACLRACAGIDTVVHLAADPSPQADFMSSLLPVNIVGSYNLFTAARAQGCRRFIYASSAQAVEGYALDVQVQEQMAPRPKNLYGASKAFGEALAALFAQDGAMVTVALRIANLAEFAPGQQHSARDVAAFISERDMVQLLERCIEAELSGFHVVHGVSDNRYKRLAIDQTRRLLGYRPADDGFAILEGETS